LRKAYRIFFILLFYAHHLVSQQVKQYSFTQFGVKNGLAAYNANAVVQDETGYIWIGTINGLQRYDGNRFITFRHNPGDRNSLPDNHIEQLHLDKENNLWLVLNDGSIGVFDTKTYTFRKAKVTQRNENNLQALRKLTEDTEGNLLYVFFNLEVLTYSKNNNEFSSKYNIFPVPLNWKVSNVTQDPLTKKYWIGTDSGMAVYNPKTKALSYKGHNIEQEPFVEKWSKILGIGPYKVDKKRRLWFLSWPINVGASRLYCYDLSKQEMVLTAYDLVEVVQKYIEPYFLL
jgi:ligand-binding sensor domain-containing protein